MELPVASTSEWELSCFANLTIISSGAIAATPFAYASDGVMCHRVAILVAWPVTIDIVSKRFWVFDAAE